jgi:hypothetical protein
MKQPKYFVETMQQCISLGLNAFALQLMAESFADNPNKFKGENVVFLAEAHARHKRAPTHHPEGVPQTSEPRCEPDCWCQTGAERPPRPRVWFIMTTEQPKKEDFDAVPEMRPGDSGGGEPVSGEREGG